MNCKELLYLHGNSVHYSALQIISSLTVSEERDNPTGS